MKTETKKTGTVTLTDTKTLTGMAVLTAVIILLQAVLGGISLGTFTITLTMVPIIIGAVMYGPVGGAILGGVFGVVVTIQVITGAAGAGSTLMLQTNAFATVFVVLLKGIAAGFMAGLFAKLFSKKSLYVGIFAAAVIAPVCNTGIFSIALVTVFGELAESWALGAQASSVANYVLTGIIGLNFVIELLVDLVLAPVVLRVIKAVRQSA